MPLRFADGYSLISLSDHHNRLDLQMSTSRTAWLIAISTSRKEFGPKSYLFPIGIPFSILISLAAFAQFEAPIKDRKSLLRPRIGCRFHANDQPLSSHLQFRRYRTDVSKRHIDKKISLRRGMGFRINEHSFCADIPCVSLAAPNYSLINPLEIDECVDPVPGVLSPFQAAFHLPSRRVRPVAPRVAHSSRTIPFPGGSQRIFLLFIEGKKRTHPFWKGRKAWSRLTPCL